MAGEIDDALARAEAIRVWLNDVPRETCAMSLGLGIGKLAKLSNLPFDVFLERMRIFAELQRSVDAGLRAGGDDRPKP